jgi:hypothetical protein
VNAFFSSSARVDGASPSLSLGGEEEGQVVWRKRLTRGLL